MENLNRRRLLQGSAVFGGMGALGLGGCATASSMGGPQTTAANFPIYDAVPTLAPIRAHKNRLFDITVCLRPFRAAGPRLDTEQLGDKLVVHNYGHGGSGWSLSWGSGSIAVSKAMASSPREVAVIGCGALGLTSAILAQQAGAKVTIYAKDLLPQTRSSRATGSWTPDSRIALTDVAGPQFGDLWEQMARTSFKTYRRYLGLPGDPVVWNDRYILSDLTPEEQQRRGDEPEKLSFGRYEDRIRDLTPRYEAVSASQNPWPTPYVRRSSSMMFNIADYAHTLMTDFFAAGGKFERMEFRNPQDMLALKEKVIINCPGYGARALWKDESITPVRGQIGWLIPQPEVNYGFFYNGVSILPRTDGIVVQAVEGGDMKGYGDDHEVTNRAESENAVDTIAELYSRMRPTARV